MSEETQPISLTPYFPMHERHVMGIIPIDRIDKLFDKWVEDKISPLPSVYIFPVSFELDATAQYKPSGPPTQGTAGYYSIAILPEGAIAEYYPSIVAISDWRVLFKRVDEKINKKNRPMFYLDGDATMQYHFCNVISRDFLNICVKSKKAEAKKSEDDAAAAKGKDVVAE